MTTRWVVLVAGWAMNLRTREHVKDQPSDSGRAVAVFYQHQLELGAFVVAEAACGGQIASKTSGPR